MKLIEMSVLNDASNEPTTITIRARDIESVELYAQSVSVITSRGRYILNRPDEPNGRPVPWRDFARAMYAEIVAVMRNPDAPDAGDVGIPTVTPPDTDSSTTIDYMREFIRSYEHVADLYRADPAPPTAAIKDDQQTELGKDYLAILAAAYKLILNLQDQETDYFRTRAVMQDAEVLTSHQGTVTAERWELIVEAAQAEVTARIWKQKKRQVIDPIHRQ